MSYEEIPIYILDRRDKQLRNKTIPLVKVLWNHHGVEEVTWELESEMLTRYPWLFDSGGTLVKFRGRNFFLVLEDVMTRKISFHASKFRFMHIRVYFISHYTL